jgi:hypothetical protein
MSELNGFRFSVSGCKEETCDGYVKMNHGQQYSLRLHNSHKGPFGCQPADVDIYIDGKFIGTYRLRYGQTMYLERSANDSGRFTAYKANSWEGNRAELCEFDSETGVIKAVFRPGKVKEVYRAPIVINNFYEQPISPFNITTSDHTDYDPFSNHVSLSYNCCHDGGYSGIKSASLTRSRCVSKSCAIPQSESLSVAGTGLSGHSDQNFVTVDDLEHNEPATTIYLRLIVSENEYIPKPLPEKRVVYSTNCPRPLRR